MKSLFASTSRGLEELLKAELTELGAQAVRLVPGGLHFQAEEKAMYQSLLWSRLASRILLPLGEFNVWSELDLYAAAITINWPELFDNSQRFVVRFKGTNDDIRNTQYGALRVKDAIVDSFIRLNLTRPTVDKDEPDIRIAVWLHKNTVSIALDLSGDALHQRNYRSATGLAPLKETLAAAIVLRSGWQLGQPFIDPMCGSGTLLIEAAMMASDRAPGLNRVRWGFSAWKQHNPELWQQVVHEAQQRAGLGLRSKKINFFGFDHDPNVLARAKSNIRLAGLASLISVKCQDISKLANPFPAEISGYLVTNPPYGERLESEPALIALYHQLGRTLKSAFGGWSLSIFSASPELLSCLLLRADKQFKAKNGPLDCLQKNYLLQVNQTIVQDPAADFANRLRKNSKQLDKWALQQGINCYRLYDADLPDYNFAIDRYAEKIVLQEYAAPKSIDPSVARLRLFTAISATLAVLSLSASKLILKTRERKKGNQQYQKLGNHNDFFAVQEFQAKFWVNLTDYLDTGLFIDHRLTRKMLGEMSRGKDFLNLFGYTGSASVHAALSGAKSTTTVDMSRTYLEWAERNFQLNGIAGREHRLIQADCLRWISEVNEKFDVVFIDPPTFSNSKRMEASFDVQRDHGKLLTDLQRILRKDGVILFSNNKRGFSLNQAALNRLGLQAKEITNETQSLDFSRNRNIHNCWIITCSTGN